MTYEEAEKLAFSSKWKIGTCGVGENCWCRTIKPENPIIYDNNEDYYIIGLEDVGGKEKKVPDDFYDAKNKQMTKDFKEWIMPIIGNFDDKYLSLSDMK